MTGEECIYTELVTDMCILLVLQWALSDDDEIPTALINEFNL